MTDITKDMIERGARIYAKCEGVDYDTTTVGHRTAFYACASQVLSAALEGYAIIPLGDVAGDAPVTSGDRLFVAKLPEPDGRSPDGRDSADPFWWVEGGSVMPYQTDEGVDVIHVEFDPADDQCTPEQAERAGLALIAAAREMAEGSDG